MGTKTMTELEAQRYRKTVTLLPLVVTGKPRASIADLSPAKQIAVIECFNNNGVHKRDGWWHGRPEGNRIAGTTVADLVRDRLLSRQGGSAQLTERGIWYACALAEAAKAEPM
jgi:hypothetical protein